MTVDRPDKREVTFQCLEKINEQLESFIRDTLESGEGPKKDLGESPCAGDASHGFAGSITEKLHDNINMLIKVISGKSGMFPSMTVKDPLTGLYSRHLLQLLDEREVCLARRHAAPLSAIVLNMDGLQKINDQFGYLMGDHKLVEFSDFLRQSARACDLLFRLSGDEFLFFMNGTDEDCRIAIEKRLLESLNDWNESKTAETPVPLAFSLGGETTLKPSTLDELIQKASAKMRTNKKNKYAATAPSLP